MKRTILFIILAAALAVPVQAAAATPEIDAGFSVRAMLPENQVKPDAGYFDLLVEPGMEQDIVVEITNPGGQPIVVTVEAVTASTNRNGLVLYAQPGIYDETMQHYFSEIAEVQEGEIEILPGESRLAVVGLKLPDEEFEGMLMGAIRVVKQPIEGELESDGIVNMFSYAIGVRLRESLEEVEPAFALRDVQAELVNHKAAFVAYIRNTAPGLMEDVQVMVEVFGEDGSPVISRRLEGVKIAPQSVFPMTLTDQAGYGFPAGNYRAVVGLEHGGEMWEFVHEFAVEPRQATAVNSSAVNQAGGPRQERSVAWVLPSAVAILLFAAMIIQRRKSAL